MQLSICFRCDIGWAPPSIGAVAGGPPRLQRTQLLHATIQTGWQPGLKGSWLLSDAAPCVMACEAARVCMADGHGHTCGDRHGALRSQPAGLIRMIPE